VDDLVQRMNTGVGAASADRRDRDFCERSERAFQRVLDGTTIRLGLPAIEAGTVVLDTERDAHGKTEQRAEPAAFRFRSA
jgi:hypothetical protein